MKTRLKEVWITKYALTTGILHTTHAYEDEGYVVVEIKAYPEVEADFHRRRTE